MPDPVIIIQIIVLFLLLILSAFFSSCETAFSSANPLRLRTLSEEGNKKADQALRILDRYPKFLSTILIGNNVVNISASALMTTIAVATGLPFAVSVGTGIFVVGIAGGAPTFGALRYYAFTLTQFDSFINYLLGNTTYLGDLGDVTADMSKLILNPLQYIQSCLWFPFTISPLGAFSTAVQIGWWTIPTDAMLVTMSDGATRQISYGIPSIPIHPQAATIGNYLRREPFSSYRMWVPPVGYVNIPADLLCDVDFVNVSYTVDIVNGSTLIDLWAGSTTPGFSQKKLYTTQAQLAVDVPLAQVMGVGNNVMQGIQQISSGKILGGIEKLVTGGIGAWMGSEISGGAVQGSTGSTAVYRRVPDLVLDYTEMAETAPTIMGRPLCQNKVINTLSGYIMTAHSHIDIYGATKQEIEAIETYMDGGFFYE